MNNRRLSLLSQTILVLSILSALFFFLVYQNINFAKETMMRIERSGTLSIVQNQLNNLSQILYFGFDKPIQKWARRILDTSDNILYLQIHTPQGKIYQFGHKQKDPSLFFHQFKLFQKGQPIGTLTMQFRLKQSENYFNDYRRIFLIDVLLFIITAFALFWIFYRNIHNLHLLANTLATFKPMPNRKLTFTPRFSEMAQIINAINTLLNTLETYSNNLQKSNKKLLSAQRIAQMASWTYLPSQQKIEGSIEFFRLLGLKTTPNTSLSLRTFYPYIHPEDSRVLIQALKEAYINGGKFRLIHRIVTTHGKIRFVRTEGKVRRSKKHPTEIVGISIDVTQEEQAKQRINYLSMHDPLTDLPNRRAFFEKISFYTSLIRREHEIFALLFIDLDNFKDINDTYGHALGDDVLRFCANLFRHTIRTSDIIARLGGDEFVIVLSKLHNQQEATTVAQKLLNQISHPITLQGHELRISLSIGIALYPKDGKHPETLLKHADAAMYEAKRLGKNRYALFDTSIAYLLDQKLKITNEIRQALNQEDQIILYFQPQINLKNQSVKGAEVLARWRHPTKGLLTPGAFLPAIESSSLMAQFDDYILERACQQLALWQREGRDIMLAVNLSASQFSASNFINRLQELKERYGFNPSYLELEITESLPLQNVEEAIATLHRIKSMGFKISIDDFGTGYSSLSYLRRIPFDTIKIDRSFIQDIDEDQDDRTIVKLMIQIAKTLEKCVVAEGPENAQHAKILSHLACDVAQGFYFSKPIDKEAFEHFVDNFKSSS